MSNTIASHQTRTQVRGATKWIHTWTGVVFGAVVSVICLTGSVIVFRQEVEKLPRLENPANASHHRSLDEAAREIARLQPGSLVTRVRFPSNPNDPYVFQIRSADKQTRRLALDVSSGKVLGELKSVAWLDWMIDLHRNVLSAKPGRKVVGGIGILAFALAATGLLLWLINGGSPRAMVTIRAGPSRRFNFELHRVTGLWTLAFVLLIALTGAGLAYPQTLRNAWEQVTGTPATMRSPKINDIQLQHARSLDEYVSISRAALPDGLPTELRVPESHTSPVVMRFWRAGDWTQTGSNRVYIDPASMKVLSTDVAANWPLGVRLFQALAPIHYGEWGGLPIKILWSLFGGAPTVLFITGLVVWWRPAGRKRRNVFSAVQAGEISQVARTNEPVAR